jgi:hypothetical protein
MDNAQLGLPDEEFVAQMSQIPRGILPKKS